MRKSANDVEKQIEPIIAVKAYKPIVKHSIAHTQTHIPRTVFIDERTSNSNKESVTRI